MSRHYPYLIVGGGMAADAAARGIRQVDSEHAIAMISSEPDPPYNRPPLSKGLWKRTPLSRIWRNTISLGVDLLLSRTVLELNAAQKRVIDNRGEEYTFDKLLLATGGDPVRISAAHERILYYRTVDDFRRLRALTEEGQRFTIIGGGFIGSEIAASLASLGKEVSMVFPEKGIGARVLPEEISLFLNDYFARRGVRLLIGQMVQNLTAMPDGVTVQTEQGESWQTEAVVAGLGIRPNSSLAREAGLKVGNGILVNPFLQTNQADIYAAGDVVSFYNPILEQRMRVEHEENANLSGITAGKGMAGQPERYDLLPAVNSSVFDLHYDAVGDLNPQAQIIYDWQTPFQKGVIYYLSAGRVRGIVLWNLSRGLEQARQLIAQPGPVQPQDLKGRIELL